MNGEQTMEDKIEYKSKTGHFWVGLRNGRDFPLNRNVYAMARSQEYRPGLRNGSIFTEFFVAKNPEIVRCSCHSMESVVKKLHFPDGTTPGLMPATWVEFMGIGEKPEPATIVVDAGNDDYRIALDLDAGNEAASKSSSRHAARAEGKAKSTILDSNDSAYSPWPTRRAPNRGMRNTTLLGAPIAIRVM